MPRILIIPASGDPYGLTSEGPAGGRMPLALRGHRCDHASHREWELADQWYRDCYMCRHPQTALVLWWDGQLVPEGWDRFVRRLLAWAHAPDHPATRNPDEAVVRALIIPPEMGELVVIE
jgi:hypothetical protein